MKLSVRNIVAVIALILLVVYGATKGLVYYKFKSAVDTASANMRIFATLRYTDISSSLLDKSVTVHGVSILPAGFEDGINIDAISLQAQSLGDLLSGMNPGRKGEFPRHMDVAMTGFKIDLYSSLIDKLEQALSQLNSAFEGTIQTACGNKLYLGPAEYRDLGYDILDSNLRFAYHFADEAIKISMDWSTKDMAAASIEMKMSGPSRASSMAMISNPPQLEEINITYNDLSYTQLSNEYCTQQGKYKSIEEYIIAASSQSDTAYALQWGFVPGPGIKQAYKEFLSNPDNIKISLRPPKGFGRDTIGLYKPEDLVGALNLEVSVNNKPVTDLSFSFTPSDPASAETVVSIQQRLQNFKSLMQQKDIQPIVKSKPRVKGPTPRFHAVAINQLKPLIGKQCRVYTKNDQVRRGILSAVTGNTINVTQQVHRGEFTMNIDKSSVEKIEVFYAR